jgi:hypothetical protein
MTRNQAMSACREGGFDCVLMLDSDNEPDGALERDPEAKPFWGEAFNLLYQRKIAGKETIVAAPYCGPPPAPGECDGGEIPYLFQWENNESDNPSPSFRLRLISRHEAALMRGMHRVAALPTGCCLLSIGVIDGMKRPYFYYEFDEENAHKKSTEDVVFTRNASLLWQQKGGDNICFAACDSWAYHHKTKVVGRPSIMPVEMVSEDFRRAVLDGHNAGDKLIDVNPAIPGNLKHAVKFHAPLELEAVAMTPSGEFRPLERLPEVDEPIEPDFEPGTFPDDDYDAPIVHRRVGGQMVTTDERWPLTEQDVAAIERLVESLPPAPRILALNVGIGDNFAALAQSVWMLESSSMFASSRGIDRESYLRNIEAVGLANAAPIPEVDPDPAVFDNQDLDLLWVGQPAACENVAGLCGQMHDWIAHLKPNGVVAGIGKTPHAAACLRQFCPSVFEQPQTIIDSDLWFVRKRSADELPKATGGEQ